MNNMLSVMKQLEVNMDKLFTGSIGLKMSWGQLLTLNKALNKTNIKTIEILQLSIDNSQSSLIII